jgi:hypothetical protein
MGEGMLQQNVLARANHADSSRRNELVAGVLPCMAGQGPSGRISWATPAPSRSAPAPHLSAQCGAAREVIEQLPRAQAKDALERRAERRPAGGTPYKVCGLWRVRAAPAGATLKS